MDAQSGSAMPLPEPTQRGFAHLDQAGRDRLAGVLQPLPWIDGLMTALAIAPGAKSDMLAMMNCLEFAWSQDDAAELDRLTPKEAGAIIGLVTDHYGHILGMLVDGEGYRPYLAGFDDPLEAAAHWAAGFCGGFALTRKAWPRLLADEDAQALAAAIFSLVSDDDMPEAVKADLPFRDMTPDQRDLSRRSTIESLPDIVLSLHALALGSDDGALAVDENGEPGENEPHAADQPGPQVRAGPKVDRNDPD